MTQATDTDIREIKDLIEKLDRKVDTGFASIREEMRVSSTEVNGKFDTVNARLTNIETNTKNVMDLAEKIGELKNWKQIAVSFLSAIVGGVIGWFVRGGTNHQ